jgi:hypothetical protein
MPGALRATERRIQPACGNGATGPQPTRRLLPEGIQFLSSSVSIPKAVVIRAQDITVSLKPSGQSVVLTRMAAAVSR